EPDVVEALERVGAHHISANAFQSLNDVGFTIPAHGTRTGTARRWARPTTRTCPPRPTRPRRPLRPSRRTPRTWLTRSSSRRTRPPDKRSGEPHDDTQRSARGRQPACARVPLPLTSVRCRPPQA